MKLALRQREPSPDWIALRKVIEGISTLRDDVVLEVGEERCRFVDQHGRELDRELRVDAPSAVRDVEGKMRLLTMLHDKFSA
jgi:hypothetical protein